MNSPIGENESIFRKGKDTIPPFKTDELPDQPYPEQHKKTNTIHLCGLGVMTSTATNPPDIALKDATVGEPRFTLYFTFIPHYKNTCIYIEHSSAQ